MNKILNLRQEPVGEVGNQRGGQFDTVELLHMALNVAGRHPSGVQGDDLLKFALAVAWNAKRKLAVGERTVLAL